MNNAFLRLLFVISMIPFESIAELRVFTDKEGREIAASLVGVSDENAILERNGSRFKWPVTNFSLDDQAFFAEWAKTRASIPLIRVKVWEQDGPGPDIKTARPNDKIVGKMPEGGTFEDVRHYTHYKIDVSNLSEFAAGDLKLEYVTLVIDAEDRITGQLHKANINDLDAGKRRSVRSATVTAIHRKTEKIEVTGYLVSPGNGSNRSEVQTKKAREHLKERFGGIWVRIYNRDNVLLEERKVLHPDVERKGFRFGQARKPGAKVIPSPF